MTKMSDELRDILEAWLSWAEGGAVTQEFDVKQGLCYHVYHNRYVGREVQVGRCTSKKDVFEELEELMHEDFGDNPYPFGFNDFDHRRETGTMHLCPKRLAWVRKVLGVPSPQRLDGAASP